MEPMSIAASARGGTASGALAFEQSAENAFDEIHQRLAGAVKGLKLHLPTVFKVGAEHPFATAVNARKIPCHPQASTPAVPYLLMEGLVPQLLDANNATVITTERVRWIPKSEKQAVNKALSAPRVLLGVSGGGRTRTLLEMLADEYGIIFVAHPQVDSDCRDFVEALEIVKAAFRPSDEQQQLSQQQYFTPHRLRAQETPSYCAESDATFAPTQKHFFALVLARLLILECLLQHFEDPKGFSPAAWLWMQLYPQYALQSSPPLQQYFHNLWKELLILPSVEYLRDCCKSVTQRIRKLESARRRRRLDKTKDRGALPCFIDECQELLRVENRDSWQSVDAEKQKACIMAALKSLNAVCRGPLVTGTGVGMAYAMSNVTANLKGWNVSLPYLSKAEMESLLRCSSYLKPADCWQYISRYLPDIEDSLLTSICRVLQGRPGFAAQFVSECMLHGSQKGVMEVFKEFEEHHVAEVNAGSLSRMASKPSMSALIENASYDDTLGGAMTMSMAMSFSFLNKMALRFALTSRHQYAMKESRLAWLAGGLVDLMEEGETSWVSISEPLVVRTAGRASELEDYLRDRMVEYGQRSPALDNELEPHLGLRLFSETQSLVIARDSPVNIDGEDIPPHFQGRWKLWYPRTALETGVIGSATRWKRDLERFFGQDPQHAIIFPNRLAGPDWICRVQDAGDETRRLIVTLEAKQCHRMSGKRMIRRTSIRDMFTKPDGMEIKGCRAHKQRVLETFGANPLPLLRVVIVYPAVLANEPVIQVVSEQEMILVIDGRNFEDVFGENTCRLLRALKPDKTRKATSQSARKPAT